MIGAAWAFPGMAAKSKPATDIAKTVRNIMCLRFFRVSDNPNLWLLFRPRDPIRMGKLLAISEKETAPARGGVGWGRHS